MRTFQGRMARVRCLAYSPDGSTLGAAGDGGTIRLWDTQEGRVRKRLRFGTTRVTSLEFSPDGSKIAVARVYSRRPVVWSVEDAKDLEIRELPPVHFMTFRPAGRGLLACGDEGVSLWDLETKKRIDRLTIREGTRAAAFHPDGSLVAVGANGVGVLFWKPAGHLDVSPIHDPRYPWAFAEAGDGFSSRDRQWTLPQRPEPFCLRFAPDGRRLAASAGWSSYLYDLESLRRIATLRGPRNLVRSLDFSPDGLILASASHDGTVRFWDVESGEERACFRWEIGKVDCVAFAPDGMTVAAGGEGGIVVWDVE